MRVLLDTHALLWFVADRPELSATARDIISNHDHEKIVSLASLWEIAIKLSLDKLTLTLPLDEFIRVHLTPPKVQLLQITIPHLLTVRSLPHHHRDPFDRLLIAQALTEDVPIISNEAVFDDYGVQRIRTATK